MAINQIFVLYVIGFFASSEAFYKHKDYSYDRGAKATNSTCKPGISSICLDCFHLGLCAATPPISSLCSTGMVCQEVKPATGNPYAQCVVASTIPACNCPATGFTQIPDIYDNQRYIVCVNGQETLQTCGTMFYDPATGKCETNAPTTTTTTTMPTTTKGPDCIYNTAVGGTQLYEATCFSAQICFQDGSLSERFFCDPYQVLDQDTLLCLPFQPFSCSNHANVVGLIGDPNNCHVFHYCVNGVEQIDATICPLDQSVFNDTLQQCSNTTTCDSIVECTCTANKVFGYNCTSFYVCNEVSPGFYEQEFQSCPPGFFVDPANMICVLEVAGCP